MTAPADGGLLRLRAAFDAAFAAPPRPAPAAVSLLALRAGGEPAAVRLLEVRGLLRPGRIVPVPSRRAELLGVVGLRGVVVPVYSLARLLGRPADEPRWAMLAGDADRVAFAFESFDGHAAVLPADLHADEGGGRAHVAGVARAADGARAILDVSSLVRAVTGR